MTYLGLFTYDSIEDYTTFVGCTFTRYYRGFTAGSTVFRIVLDIENGSLTVYETAEDYLEDLSTVITPTFI